MVNAKNKILSNSNEIVYYNKVILKNTKMIKEKIQNDRFNIVKSKIKYSNSNKNILYWNVFRSQNIDIEEIEAHWHDFHNFDHWLLK